MVLNVNESAPDDSINNPANSKTYIVAFNLNTQIKDRPIIINFESAITNNDGDE